MNSEQFAYWLQGFAELNSSPPTQEQWMIIKEHLALVFDKVTIPLDTKTPISGPGWRDLRPSGVSGGETSTLC